MLLFAKTVQEMSQLALGYSDICKADDEATADIVIGIGLLLGIPIS